MANEENESNLSQIKYKCSLTLCTKFQTTSTSNGFIILGMFIAGSTNAPKTGSDHRFPKRPLSIWNELSKQIWTRAKWHLCSKCAGMALSSTNRTNLFDWKPSRPVWELSRVSTKTVMPKKSLKYIKGDKRKILKLKNTTDF